MGEALVEFVRQDKPDGPECYKQGFGGDTSNTAIAAARQGCSTGYISAVGDDPFGQALLELWHRENVDTSRVELNKTAPTGIYFVDPDPQQRNFTYYRSGSAASLITPDSLDSDYIAGARILHISGISLAISKTARDSVKEAMSIARTNGVKISLDTNLRLKLWSLEEAQFHIDDAMKSVDIALPSYDDATELTGLADRDAIIDYYLDLGPSIVALKLGSEGCRLAFDGERFDVPAVPADAVDSTGAGDTFAGAFLARYIKSGDPLYAARHACAAASIAVSGFGAVDPIPDEKATIARLEIDAVGDEL